MPTFPTLTKGPVAVEFTENPAYDSTISTPFQAGKRLTRAQSTYVPKTFHVVITDLSQTDKDTLDIFITETVNYGGLSFTWENPQKGIEGDNRTVRFLPGTIKMGVMSPSEFPQGEPTKWRAELDLEEV